MLIGDDPEGRVGIFVHDILALVCHGYCAADGIKVVAIDFIRSCHHGQKPPAVNVVAGNGVIFIGLGQEVAGSVVDIAGGYTIAGGFQPVGGPVVEVLARIGATYTYQAVLIIKQIRGAFVHISQLALKIIAKSRCAGCQKAVSLHIVCITCCCVVEYWCERLCLINTGPVAIVIQGEVIGCNGTRIRLSVLKIRKTVSVVIAIAGPCAVEMINAC